jgi:light-regulated signal transduction histidine kinase (bacteriophytochrome)
MTVAASSEEDWNLALSQCASEPIQFIGQIQAGSVLIAIDPKADRFTFLSEHANAVLAKGDKPLWDLKPSEILGASQLQSLVKRAAAWSGRGARLVDLQLPELASQPAWLHFSGRHLVLEMDVRSYDRDLSPDMWEWDDLLRDSLTRVENSPDLASKLEVVVEETMELGQFDRVMIYRFLDDGTGEVAAERVRADWEPYLGLRYPASDIPAQARELFFKNDIRLIREVSSLPVALHAAPGSDGKALDLSLARFRQPSPIHLEYLKNMGVNASFVSAIVSEGKLWGLISCHHGSPLHLTAARQAHLAALTNHLAVDIAGMAREVKLRNELACARVTSKLIQCITVTDDWTSVLISMAGELCEILGADGLSLHFDGADHTSGLVPPHDVSKRLIESGLHENGGLVFPTVRDPRDPQGTPLPAEIGGALVIPLSHFRDDALIFFRQERTRKITWAGDPVKAVDRGSDGVPRLKPRESFAAWQETVRGTCDAWTENDLAVAGVMRATLQDIVITAHYFRQSLESPATARHRLAHEMDLNPVVLADENGIVVFQNQAAAGDALLNHLQSLDLLVTRLNDGKSADFEKALHSLVHLGEDIRVELTPQRWVEAKRLTDYDRLVGYSIRVIAG